uniref:Uncharacterized protein n=1 Tax=viral metagenome TaxID=1070528 RepID=A0A6C0I3J8_9ZZZZ
MFTLLLLFMPCMAHGFNLPRIALWRSPLEAIVAQRTMFSVLNDRINDELISDTQELLVSHYHYHLSIDTFYFAIFLFTLYWRFAVPVTAIDAEVSKTTRRITNMFLLFVYILFVKNVQCAT